MTTPVYKLCLIGESGSGKTSYLHRCLTGDYNQDHVPTVGVQVSSFQLSGIIFNIWDCAGDSKLIGLGESYYIGAHCCFIFVTPHTSIASIKAYKKSVDVITPNIPIVVVINKCDNNYPSTKQEIKVKNLGLRVCSISVKNNWNLRQPFALL